jgi:predicted nuclease with RNAse H fold
MKRNGRRPLSPALRYVSSDAQTYAGLVITVGVDLATEPANTAMAVLHWSSGGAVVHVLGLGIQDTDITDAARDADKLGIDCPLGWPDDFLRFLQEHHAGHVVAPQDLAGRDWRRKVAYRATDRAVKERTGLTPLSVAADRIGLTAMRAAGILSLLAADGRPVDRAGTGIVVEVYPAASLRCWGLPFRAYKGAERRDARQALLSALLAKASWLDLGADADLCAGSDDALDAVIAALTGGAAALSKTAAPDSDLVGQIRQHAEGAGECVRFWRRLDTCGDSAGACERVRPLGDARADTHGWQAGLFGILDDFEGMSGSTSPSSPRPRHPRPYLRSQSGVDGVEDVQDE